MKEGQWTVKGKAEGEQKGGDTAREASGEASGSGCALIEQAATTVNTMEEGAGRANGGRLEARIRQEPRNALRR